MKKILTFLFLTVIFLMPSYAKSLKASVSKNIYLDYLSRIELTEKQKVQIEKIKAEEEAVITPLVLELNSKDEGTDFLKNLKCDMFDKKCKKKLKLEKGQNKADKKAVERKIELKHSYYRTKYRNVLTREQDYKIQQMAEEEAYIKKVEKERAQREFSKKKESYLSY